MRHQQPCHVSNIFRQHLFAIDTKVGKRTVAVELLDKLLPRLAIPGVILCRPPISEAALCSGSASPVSFNTALMCAWY
jgi:hypothetical protein